MLNHYKGNPMPKRRPKQQLLAIVPAQLADRVRAQAQQEGRSVSNWLNKVLRAEFEPEQLEMDLRP